MKLILSYGCYNQGPYCSKARQQRDRHVRLYYPLVYKNSPVRCLINFRLCIKMTQLEGKHSKGSTFPICLLKVISLSYMITAGFYILSVKFMYPGVLSIYLVCKCKSKFHLKVLFFIKEKVLPQVNLPASHFGINSVKLSISPKFIFS